MNKYFWIFLLFLFSVLPANAINWQEVTTKYGQTASIDVDSITTLKTYYLYNIKVINVYTKKPVVITMQSSARNSLSARINFYDLDKYEELNGDYEHIADNFTKKLEPAEYGSIAQTCYAKVKSIILSRQIKIQL